MVCIFAGFPIHWMKGESMTKPGELIVWVLQNSQFAFIREPTVSGKKSVSSPFADEYKE
jgi:hypothetical protein